MKYSLIIMAFLGYSGAVQLAKQQVDERAGTSAAPIPFAADGAQAKPTKQFEIPKNKEGEPALSTSASDATAYHTGSGYTGPHYQPPGRETVEAAKEEAKADKASKVKVAGGADDESNSDQTTKDKANKASEAAGTDATADEAGAAGVKSDAKASKVAKAAAKKKEAAEDAAEADADKKAAAEGAAATLA